jgi:hypothetical protein
MGRASRGRGKMLVEGWKGCMGNIPGCVSLSSAVLTSFRC